MTEHNSFAESQQAIRFDGVSGRFRDTEPLSRPPDKRQIARRVRRGDEQQAPRVTRKPRQPAREALLDLSGQGQRRRQAEPTGELCWRQAAWQLQHRERIPVRLEDDAFQYTLIQPPWQGGLQERTRIPVAQRLDLKLW